MENDQKETQEETGAESGLAAPAEAGEPLQKTAEETKSGEKPPEDEAGEPREDLTKLLEDARAKADEHWDQLLRSHAEMENLKRRHARDLENAHKFALDSFVRELLQVWDSLELGHSAALEQTADVEKLREGTELTLKLFGDVMAKFNVAQIDPAGKPFNPDFHQAMSMQQRGDMPPNHVVTVVQKGYTLNGRLVRPALVIVSRAPD